MTPSAQDEDLEPDAFREAVMNELLRHDIAEVTIVFDGSSDEGQIESITCTQRDGSKGSLDFPAKIPGTIIPGGETVWNPLSGRYATEPVDRPSTMAKVLDEWAFELLDETGVDWVNGEGGFGEIVIAPATNLIRCTMNARIIDTETSRHEL
jgi:hypothetical protein